MTQTTTRPSAATAAWWRRGLDAAARAWLSYLALIGAPPVEGTEQDAIDAWVM